MIWLAGKLVGWRGYAAVAAFSGVFVGVGVYQAQSWRYGARIATIKEAQAEVRAKSADASLAQLRRDIEAIAVAGQRAAAVGPFLTAQINQITGALKNAPPLPDGCRPDPVRVRSLTDAVRATNSAAAGQQPVGAVSSAP